MLGAFPEWGALEVGRARHHVGRHGRGKEEEGDDEQGLGGHGPTARLAGHPQHHQGHAEGAGLGRGLHPEVDIGEANQTQGPQNHEDRTRHQEDRCEGFEGPYLGVRFWFSFAGEP